MSKRSGLPPSGVRSAELTRVVLPAEIRVVDEARREIEVCATSEAVDTYGTVFGYEASRDAFSRWAGNVREMHERKAVGRRVDVRFDDADRKVFARVRISAGAEDTWQKVLDGTLRGASIGAANVEWANRRRDVDGASREVPVAQRYDLMELSLVDLASNPDADGLAIVRDGVPNAELLDDVAPDAVSPGGPVGAPVGPVELREGAGNVELRDQVDPVQAIAAAALARGQAQIASGFVRSEVEPDAGASAKRDRLARLGAPGYVAPVEQRAASTNVLGQVQPTGAPSKGDVLGGTAPGQGAGGMAVGQAYDVDGDHEDPSDYVTIQSGPTAGAVPAPSPAGSVAYMAHVHAHTGFPNDAADHREMSGHAHYSGAQHVHDHVMDHQHGETHPRGASHLHGHVPDHRHSYRCADGSAIDARLVTVEQARTWEYVSAAAFRAAGGTEGSGLSVSQLRVAQAHELRLGEMAARALGPYSRNPGGAPDAGTPDQAQQHDSTNLTGEGQIGDGNGGVPAVTSGVSDLEAELFRTGRCPLCQGQIRALDRDGRPVTPSDGNAAPQVAGTTTGQVDVSVPADGWSGRVAVAEMTRVVEAGYRRLAGELGAIREAGAELERRLVAIEAQPMPGGPQLRVADKGSPLRSAGRPDVHAQYEALEALGGKITDPQAQVAVAAEMIRLQAEAAGVPPAMQVMPRAGRGWQR